MLRRKNKCRARWRRINHRLLSNTSPGKDIKLFRLVKILNNSNINQDIAIIDRKLAGNLRPGSAAVCSNGMISVPELNACPEYVVVSTTTNTKRPLKTACYPINEDMIFKINYNDTVTPRVGMRVGITSSENADSDSVIYSSNGKGIITDVDESKKFVYVKFTKI